MRNDFAIFILTHGRPDRVFTFEKLKEFKYTGRVYLVCDDEDKTLPEYRAKYGDMVLAFSKEEMEGKFDAGDNFQGRRGVIYARNACWDIARQVGVRYFMQFDDDYKGFYIRNNAAGEYGSFRAECLDQIIEAMIDYFAAIPALSIAMSQGGDHIAGAESNPVRRKAMNTFLCDVERPFSFFGRINEDVNMYVRLGHIGGLFLTIPTVQVNQKQTQTNADGMTTLYRDYGTYVKSFYSVMYVPSAVKIDVLHRTETRIHHKIDWRAAVPQIVRQEHRKT
jgi:hypothetical protein